MADNNSIQSNNSDDRRRLAREWGARAEEQLKIFENLPLDEINELMLHSYEYWRNIKRESESIFAELHREKQERKQSRNKSGKTKAERTAEYQQQATEKFLLGLVAAQKQAKDERTAEYNKQVKATNKLVDSIEKTFGSSKIAQIFKSRYVSEGGVVSEKGKFVAKRMQEQNQFIRKLVRAFATLPVFQKTGRAFQQLSKLFFIQAISKWKRGDKLGAIGSGAAGIGLAATPLIAKGLWDFVGKSIANKFSEVVLKSRFFGGLFDFRQKISGLVKAISQIFSKIPWGGVGKFLGGAGGRVLGGTALAAWAVFDAFKSVKKGDEQAARGNISEARWTKTRGITAAFTGLGAGALAGGAIGTAIGGPLGTAIGVVIGGLIYKLTHDFIDTINKPAWFETLTSMLPWLKDRNKNKGGGQEGGQLFGGNWFNPFIGSKIDVEPRNVDPTKYTSWSDDARLYRQFGTSKGQRRGIGILGSNYSKAQLALFGKTGQHGLETLRGGGGVGIDANSFINDAMVARAGSSALLAMVAKSMGAPLTVTSALASSSSGHALGNLGHSGGQTFDFSAAGMTAAQATEYAARMYATGYFSHARAEYDKKTKQWHIDARLSDQAYEMLKQQQAPVSKPSPVQTPVVNKSAPVAKEPPGTGAYTKIPTATMNIKENGTFCSANGIN